MTPPEPTPDDASFAGEPRRPVEGRTVAGVGLCISRQPGLPLYLAG
ncbi:MAG: hypothetical protein M0Z69_01145 [Actinomycetota bacterium]|nr:hypothetical protein [Actinomycetota bacterium]